MIPDSILDILKNNESTPDAGLVRVLAVDVLAAHDAVPEEKRDTKWIATRFGSANALRELKRAELHDSLIVIIPIGYLRHCKKLMG